MEENYKDEMIVIDNVNRYNEIFGLETKHPLVSIIDLTKSTTWPTYRAGCKVCCRKCKMR